MSFSEQRELWRGPLLGSVFRVVETGGTVHVEEFYWPSQDVSGRWQRCDDQQRNTQVLSRALTTRPQHATAYVLGDVSVERIRQDAKWGEQNHELGIWSLILLEELGEAARARLEEQSGGEPIKVRRELVQAAAVAVAMIECGDRNGWWPR